ncbi:pentatricopeptide repeat-containing protein At2g13600 [Selaginella moellendorffii]|nr:pentatricopeptide repeat-containing protein At2g13600 [Selaginella moellendorffii]|eukprot:XP_002971985.2 pentatricopeptide repeat-containing protein At2g13600 [Selaginella moellendorffii]
MLLAQAARSGVDRLASVGNPLIQMFGELGRVFEARAAFDRLQDPSVVSWNVMFTAYARNGHPEKAKELFDRMPDRSVVSWNAMIGLLAGIGDSPGAMRVFRMMNLHGERPVRATFLSALEAIDAAEARFLRAVILEAGMESNVAVGTALVKFLSKAEKVDEAWALFLEMPSKNIVSWTTMLGALAQHGNLRDSKALFDRMAQGNAVSWNTLICGYAHAGHSREALGMFLAMDLAGMEPECVTFAAAVEACSQLLDLAQGRRIHSEITAAGIISEELGLGVANALINLYGRCGRMDLARACFDLLIHERILRSNSIPWTSIVGHYARNGYPAEAMELFHAMAVEGLSQTPVLFISMLSSCSHGGKLEIARRLFLSMIQDYGQDPTIDHFMCMLDLLARNGKLGDAQDLIQALDLQSEELIAWRTLVAACKSHGDLPRGRGAVEMAMAADDAMAAPYVMLSAMYREQGVDGGDGNELSR